MLNIRVNDLFQIHGRFCWVQGLGEIELGRYEDKSLSEDLQIFVWLFCFYITNHLLFFMCYECCKTNDLFKGILYIVTNG